MKKVLLATALLMLINVQSSSASEKYFGVNLVKIDDFGMNLQGTLGSYLWSTGSIPIAAEGRASFSISDEDGLELDYHLGGYLRPEFRVDKIRPYGLLGISYAKASCGGISNTDTDLSFGIGLNYDMPQGWILNAEFMLQLVDDVDGISVGFSKRF